MARFKLGDLVRTYDKKVGTIVEKRHKRKGRPTGWRVQFTTPVLAKNREYPEGQLYASGWYATGDIDTAHPVDALAALGDA